MGDHSNPWTWIFLQIATEFLTEDCPLNFADSGGH